MFRSAIVAGTLALAGSVVHAQQPTKPQVPEDALTPRELIAWTSLQTPRPVEEQPPAIQSQPGDRVQDPRHRPQQATGSQAQPEPAISQVLVQPSARIRTR